MATLKGKTTKWDTGGWGLRMAVLNDTNAAFHAVILRIHSSLNAVCFLHSSGNKPHNNSSNVGDEKINCDISQHVIAGCNTSSFIVVVSFVFSRHKS